MKLRQKRRVAQKLWAWICLSINCLILTLFLEDKAADYLTEGILFSVLIICYGVVKTLADRSKDDLTGASVAIEYICVYIITFLSAFKVAEYLLCIAVLLWMAVVSVAELLIFLLITYWNTIRNILSSKTHQ